MYPVLTHTGQPFDPQLARALGEIHIAAFVLQQPALGPLLATASIVIRTAVLPRWLGYLAALAAAMSFVAVVVPSIAFGAWLVFDIWMVGTGIALLRQLGKRQPRAFAAPSSARKSPWSDAQRPGEATGRCACTPARMRLCPVALPAELGHTTLDDQRMIRRF